MDDDQPTQLADPTTETSSTAPACQPALVSESQFGANRLIRRIGSGGMGDVWLARDELLGRDVAIKFLNTSVTNREDPAFQSFIQGAKVAAAVDHPALNKVFHADVANTVPYLVLEFLDGVSLAEIVARSGPLPAPVVRAIIEPICDAVAELHHRDLLHRDIKPANIMLTKGGRVVLTDFGLARSGPANALRSNTARVAGTPRYMAPEMFDGTVSARTDVYAIGMTVYFLLSGRPAFSGSVEDLKVKHKTVEIDLAPLRSAGVNDRVIDVVVRATSKDFLYRPKTARHLLEAFSRAFDETHIDAASHESLAQLHQRPSEAVDQPPAVLADSGNMSVTLAEFAQRKREQRKSLQEQEVPVAEAQGSSAEVETLRGDKRRVLIATVAGSVVGSIAGFAALAGLGFLDEKLLDALFPNVDQQHPTAKAVVVFACFLVTLLLGTWLVMLGSATLAYRRIRGKVLPLPGSSTRCGWCQHELRGITTPVCAECGHRIGETGPDEAGNLPRARRRLRRVTTWLLLGAIVVAVYVPVGLVTPAVAVGVHHLKHGGTVDRHFVRRLMLSFSVFGEFAGVFTALLYYETVLQFRLKFSGLAWCKLCRGELAALEKPACPACGAGI